MSFFEENYVLLPEQDHSVYFAKTHPIVLTINNTPFRGHPKGAVLCTGVEINKIGDNWFYSYSFSTRYDGLELDDNIHPLTSFYRFTDFSVIEQGAERL